MAEYHTVKQGECLSSIAKKHGFMDYRTVYEHPRNAGFRRKRPNAHVIHPGDEIYIPDKGKKKEPCSTDREHRFRIHPPKALLHVLVKDMDGDPLANAVYKLTVEKQTYEGTTDGSGLLKQEIPIGAQIGKLVLPKWGLRWTLQIGHLDPVEEVTEDKAIMTGVQARLNNLGFYCGKVDGVLGPRTTEALKSFQESVLKREEPDGTPDKETRKALLEKHSS